VAKAIGEETGVKVVELNNTCFAQRWFLFHVSDKYGQRYRRCLDVASDALDSERIIFEADTMDWMITPFSSNDFMLQALVAGVLVSIACAIAGTFVILRAWLLLAMRSRASAASSCASLMTPTGFCRQSTSSRVVRSIVKILLPTNFPEPGGDPLPALVAGRVEGDLAGLGQILLERKKLTPEQLDAALKDLATAIGKRDKDQRNARTYGMHFVDYFPHRELGIAYYHKGDLVKAAKELEEMREELTRLSYTDDLTAKTTIFDTWTDSYTNNTGATVGHPAAPFAEPRIVNEGRQSMPLE
jgi:hypothetical protein